MPHSVRIALLFSVTLWSQNATELFEKRVRPVLATQCQTCHNAKVQTAGVDLTSEAGFRKVSARLLDVTSYSGRVKMPPSGKLPASDIAALGDWIRAGAPWPATTEAQPKAGHWAFLPLQNAAPPSSTGHPIDAFLNAKRPAPTAAPADRRTLLRRAAFDLTGLPPSEELQRQFLSGGTFAEAIDTLLASPRYGEKWGRHWLDVARYADSTGADEDHRYPYAWKYRDWVIHAFNRDLPFREFVRDQIAGDLQTPPPGHEVSAPGIIATGFLALGPKLIAEQDKVKMFYDAVDEQIDVAGKAFLGLTISCARCHDHKFDPISTKDYYGLASIFASTRQFEQIEGTVSKLFYAPLSGRAEAEQWTSHQQRLEKKQKEIDAVIAAQARSFRNALAPRIADYMRAARRVIEGGAADPALDAAVLDRWVTYLKPNKERRIHLEAWYRDGDADAYQKNYVDEITRREKAQADFAAGLTKEAPKFPAGANRFFTEITAAKGPLGLPEKNPEQGFPADAQNKLASLRAELKALKDNPPKEPPFACGVAEDKPVDQHVFVRGNPEAKGDLVPKRFPVVLAGDRQPAITSISGRKELADWMADPSNPLPVRVMVNRIWQGHFGQGIVRTPNNFGIAGERPSHPELLEWLAAEFLRRGGSMKQMHRLIMLSDAYQMSGEASPLHLRKDADNRFLTRFPMRRKTVEEIRDTLLLLDGSIDLTLGGALAEGTGTDNEFSDARKSMHPDNSKRRTVYLQLRRSNLATLFSLFDFGDATTSTEIREQTNVAPQALYMMNSKFVAERSKALAEKIVQSESIDDARMQRLWQTVLGRAPDSNEQAAARAYIAKFPGDASLAWASLCRTLIASNEFIYIQ
ncbi:MAG: DUF1553 domain-containing protein [Acidobacteria bacterium]|nr:DUF1553 domain-containing protein [Acidobacteriota bacterium]